MDAIKRLPFSMAGKGMNIARASLASSGEIADRWIVNKPSTLLRQGFADGQPQIFPRVFRRIRPLRAATWLSDQ
jgi:hypothetical protein